MGYIEDAKERKRQSEIQHAVEEERNYWKDIVVSLGKRISEQEIRLDKLRDRVDGISTVIIVVIILTFIYKVVSLIHGSL